MRKDLEELKEVLAHQVRQAHIVAFKMKQTAEYVRGTEKPKSAEASNRFFTCMSLIHMAAVSGRNMLKLIDSSDLAARDLYGMSRSCAELCVNFAFVLLSEYEVVETIREHAKFLYMKRMDRERKLGGWTISVQSNLHKSDEFNSELDNLSEKFTTKKGKNRNWSELSVYNKIDFIGLEYGKEATIDLSAAVDLIYEVSSEYLHGSIFSAYHFFGVDRSGRIGGDRGEVENNLHDNMQESLLSAILALQGAMKVFSLYVRDDALSSELRMTLARLSKIVADSDGSEWTAEIS